MLVERATLANGTAPFWVRAFVFINELPAANNKFELLSAEQSQSPFLGGHVVLDDGDVILYSQFDNMTAQVGIPAQAGVWSCAIWHVIPSTGIGMLDLQGELAVFSLSSQTDGTPQIDSIGIGMHFPAPNVGGSQPAIDLWIDDVIVHNAAVTCAD